MSLHDTPYYHCISRCVRRAFLCGEDAYTNQSFEHRKPWLTDRLYFLASVFAIDIAAYAVMSNHYHAVLHVDSARATNWTEQEVIHRWRKLYTGPVLIHDFLRGTLATEAEKAVARKVIALWRARLMDISWFMRCLNEYIARKANQEDGCTGRFWEGRFKSQALRDEAALLSCMAYVDLNPVRAGIAKSLKDSNHTSVQARLMRIKVRKPSARKKLMSFNERVADGNNKPTIPFGLKDYLELVEWTGRQVRGEKKGFICNTEPTILTMLGINHHQWRYLALIVQKRTLTSLNGMDMLVRLGNKRKVA